MAISLHNTIKHLFGPNPYLMVTIQSLINYDRCKRFAILTNSQNLIFATLKMAIISCCASHEPY